MTTRQKVWGSLAILFALGLVGSRIFRRDYAAAAAQINADLNTDEYRAEGSTLVIKQPCKPHEAEGMRQMAAKYGFTAVRCE